MTDLTYLNRVNLRDEARYFFEQDFTDIAKDFTIGSDGNKVYGDIYKQNFDPYRHIYGSAVLTREFGLGFSKVLGDLNEFDFYGYRKNPALEKNQDLWNNSIGRQIGSDNPSGRLIADRIKAAFEKGDAIIDHQTDQRIYTNETRCYNLDMADSFSKLLTKYNFNQSLSDYSNITPSIIINDGQGNNFNLLAFPNFSNLTGVEQKTAWDGFTNSFLETALLPLNQNPSQFTDFLNQSRISFSELERDFSQVFGGEESAFSSAFDTYFTNVFLKESGLDSSLFTISVNNIDGKEEITKANIVASDEDFDDYAQVISDPNLISIEESFALSAEDYRNLLRGEAIDRFGNMDDFEEDLNRVQEGYFTLQNALFADLSYEQQRFVEEFDDALQELIAANPNNWQDVFSNFSSEWENEWSGRINNLVSIHESEMFAMLDEYQKVYYSANNLEIDYVEGILKSEFSGQGLDWEFEPTIYDDGYFEGFGYYEMTDSFYTDKDYSRYWEYLDTNGDDLITQEEYSEDFDLFYDLYSDREEFEVNVYGFDYEGLYFSDYWSSFDYNDDGLISEEEFYEDWRGFISYLEDNGYYESIYAFDYNDISENGPEYFEQFDNNGDGLIDEDEFGGDFYDYREWTFDVGDGWLVGFDPYDEIDWSEYQRMSDWSPWETPEDAFDYAHLVVFDRYNFFDYEALENAFFEELDSVNYEQNWVYVEDYYNLEDFWYLEVGLQISGFETDYSAAFFDQFASFNSWKLDLLESWQNNQTSYEVGFNPQFELDPFLTYRQIFDEFGFEFQLDDSLYLPAPINQNFLNSLSEEDRNFLQLSTKDFQDVGDDSKLISANAFSNQIILGDGNDVISSQEGDDFIFAGGGDDVLIGGSGNDNLRGEEGKDIYVFDGDFGDDLIFDEDGLIIINGQILAGIANQSDNQNRFILGSTILSFAEDDLLISVEGSSIIVKNFENGKFGITLNRNPENSLDYIEAREDREIEINILENSSDPDLQELQLFSIINPEFGSAEITENGKIKYVPEANFIGKVNLRYLLGDGFGGFLEKNLEINIQPKIQLFSGTEGDDFIVTGVSDDVINTGAGNDKIESGAGNDTINGNAGNDLIYGGEGDDNIRGSNGQDTIHGGFGNDNLSGGGDDDLIYGDEGDDFIDGVLGNDQLFGGAGNDKILGNAGNDRIYGEDGNDELLGNLGNDEIYGGSGDDNIDGNQDNDILYGEEGNDRVRGGIGDDLISGGLGSDTLIGAAGNDVFLYQSIADSTDSESDIILDFIQSEDKIDFSTLNFNSITKGLGSNSSLNGLEFYFQNGQTIIDDPNSNFAIKLAGEIELGVGDFNF
jgi:Ca2+-binding RTX toxin-like protein